MVLTEDLIQRARSHPYGERQAGTIGVGQAASRGGCLTADSVAEEILAHSASDRVVVRVIIGFDGSVSSGKQTIGTEMSSIFADHQTGRYGRIVLFQNIPRSSTADPTWSRK